MIKVQERAWEKRCLVSIPTTPRRYDLVLDDHGKLYRIQVKYGDGRGTKSQGTVVVRLQHRSSTYSADEIDAVIVYLPVLDRCAWFPVQLIAGKQNIQVRFKASVNNQAKRVLHAHEFLW